MQTLLASGEEDQQEARDSLLCDSGSRSGCLSFGTVKLLAGKPLSWQGCGVGRMEGVSPVSLWVSARVSAH